MREVGKKICPTCNSVFSCGGICWCNEFPTILPVFPNKGCLCKNCLTQRVVYEIVEYMSDLTIQKMLKVKKLGKPEQLIEGIDYNINTEGLLVMSGWYLLRQGKCCGNNCTNCPYKNLKEL